MQNWKGNIVNKTTLRIAKKQKDMISSRVADGQPFKLIVSPDHRNIASTMVWIKDDNGVNPFIEVSGYTCGSRTQAVIRRSVDRIAQQIKEQYPDAEFQVEYQ